MILVVALPNSTVVGKRLQLGKGGPISSRGCVNTKLKPALVTSPRCDSLNPGGSDLREGARARGFL